MKLTKEEKAKFLADPEYNQHVWKKYPGIITCKKCGLVKGSGFTKCESQDSKGESGK